MRDIANFASMRGGRLEFSNGNFDTDSFPLVLHRDEGFPLHFEALELGFEGNYKCRFLRIGDLLFECRDGVVQFFESGIEEGNHFVDGFQNLAFGPSVERVVVENIGIFGILQGGFQFFYEANSIPSLADSHVELVHYTFRSLVPSSSGRVPELFDNQGFGSGQLRRNRFEPLEHFLDFDFLASLDVQDDFHDANERIPDNE